MLGFAEGEFRNRGVKLELQTLQENGVEDAAFRALPAQDAVTKNQLDALGFAIDTPVQGIKSLKDAHGLARGDGACKQSDPDEQ